MLASTVMVVPTIRLTTIVRVAKTVPACGRSIPNATKSAFIPFPTPSPRNRPMIDATRPITNPSRTTETSTCRREPPSVRSVANSRVRWATVIDSVLKMTNAPTNRATPPKPSRKYVMNAIPSFVSAASAEACAAPVCTSAVAGTRGSSACTSSSGEVPCVAATEMESKCPSFRNRACAVGTSKTANVAPPIESTEPNLATPVISYCLTGPNAATPTASPTPKPSLAEVLASITTWSAPRAHLPAVRLRGEKRRCSVSSPTPNVGAPPLPPIFLPSGSTSCAGFEFDWRSKMPPAASWTSGRPRISSRTLAATGARPLDENSSSCLPLTTASVSAYDSLKMLSNAFWKVSVRTYVPLIIATPRTTARAVRRLRILRPKRPLSATPIISPSPPPSPR